MRAVVVYESIFGNTQAVAERVAAGLRRAYEVEVVEVSSAPVPDGTVHLLVVGGPIHAWAMSREGTRDGARMEAEQLGIDPVSDGDGIREWLGRLGELDGLLAASFDTATAMPDWFPVGSAAKPASRRLEGHGAQLIAEPEHFFVHGKHGPVVDGELERAEAWARSLVELARQA